MTESLGRDVQQDQLPEVLHGLQQWWVLHYADHYESCLCIQVYRHTHCIHSVRWKPTCSPMRSCTILYSHASIHGSKDPLLILCRLLSCQQVQADIDKKIKWAVDATEAQQKAQSDLESSVAKLQQELKTQVCRSCFAAICRLSALITVVAVIKNTISATPCICIRGST